MFTREHALVEQIKKWSASGLIGDDCAVIPGGHLLTTDTLVEGTHFALPLISWRDLGWKAIAVNLSDVAAMAGRPRHVLTSITVPSYMQAEDFESLFQAMAACCRIYDCDIAGGDLTKGPCLSITVAVYADVHEDGMLSRSGAKVDDVVVVTGDFGASAAGWWLLQNRSLLGTQTVLPTQDMLVDLGGGFNHCMQAHVHPLPRLCESWAAVRRTGSRGALMDASDGLADALVQLTRASRLGMQIDLEKLPIADETRRVADLAQANPLDWALYGGEDYELVACLPQSVWREWQSDNPFKEIGRVCEKAGVELLFNHEPAPELDLSKCFEQINF